MKWTHVPENLEIFLQEANSFHPTIRFMAEVSNEKHVFLDTKSRLVGNNIDMDLYTKLTDTHQYLPYSLALRIRRICSNPDTFEKSRKENPQKLTQLSSRSHPRHLVRKRTTQKDTIIDITSDSQVNSNFPYRWSPVCLTLNNYFLPIFIFIYNVNNHK